MNILITGAGKGIGFEIVKFCIEKGFTNIFALSKNTSQLDALNKELPESQKINIIEYDLQDLNNFQLIKSKILFKCEGLSYLINNAGLLINKPFSEITQQDMVDSYNINVFAPYFLIQKLLPILNDASIINITSMGAVQGSSKYPGLSAYSSSKGALTTISEILAVELKQQNITCNALALGAVQTEMLSKAFPGFIADTSPAEMARFIINFALDSGKRINGKIIQVSNSNP